MSLAQMLQQTGAITSMAKELGVDEKTAMTAAGALLPAIIAGMGRTATGGTETPDPLGGLGSLAGAILGSGGGAQMLDAVLGNDPTPTAAGNNILGSIFGGNDVNQSIAGEVSALTGIDQGLLKQMLPILTMAVAGYLAKQAAGAIGGTAPVAAGAVTNPLGGILGAIVSGMAKR